MAQAQSRVREAQEAVAAVEKDIKTVKEGSPQTTGGGTRSRTRSGRVRLYSTARAFTGQPVEL